MWKKVLHSAWFKLQTKSWILKCDHSNEATAEQYFPVVLFIMLYKVVLTFESVDEILKCDHSMKATEQYFPVVLFIMLYKVALTIWQQLSGPSGAHVLFLFSFLEGEI